MNKEKNHKTFYTVTLIIGLLLLMIEIGIFRQTVIPIKVPFTLTLASTLATFLIIQKDYRKTYKRQSWIFPFLQSLTSIGFMTCYLFMALNYFFAGHVSKMLTLPILSKHTIGTKNSQPAIEIDYLGLKKQLVFSGNESLQVDTATKVYLTVRNGLFGYDIIDKIHLK